jgi:hypothetical protein
MTSKRSWVARCAAAAGVGLGVAAVLRARRPPKNEAHAPGHQHRTPAPSVRRPAHDAERQAQTVVSHHSGHVHKG